MAKHRSKSQVTKTCPKCSTEKELTEFGRDASRPDGRYTYCKQCRHNPNRKDRVVLELAEKGLKSCTLCAKVKPFAAFERDSSKSLGVSSRCKKCKSEQRKKAADWHGKKPHLRELERNGFTECYRCNVVKPLNLFMKSSDYPTGYCRLCLDCNDTIKKSHRAGRRKGGRDYTRWEVFEDDDFTCYLCEEVLSPDTPATSPKALSIDHVVPLSRGGIDERSNVRTACLECNRNKNDMLLEEFFVLL